RNPAVEEHDQLVCGAPGGSVGRLWVLTAGSAERVPGGPRAVGGEPEAPGVAPGVVIVDDGRLVRPRRRAAGGQELVDPIERHVAGQRLRCAHRYLGIVGVHGELLELVPGDGTAGLRRL